MVDTFECKREDHPQAAEFARRFSDDLRILMYGNCDMVEQVKQLAKTLATYDQVAASWDDNHLLTIILTKCES